MYFICYVWGLDCVYFWFVLCLLLVSACCLVVCYALITLFDCLVVIDCWFVC